MRAIAILLASCLPLGAAEESRTWTDIEGRTLSGRLVAKNADSVRVRLDTGREVRIEMEKLSEECRKYAEGADLSGEATMVVKTAALRSNTKSGKDKRALDITLAQVGKAELEVVVIWLGDGPGSGKYGVWKTDTFQAEDGTLRAETIYSGSASEFGANFRGWVVGLKNEEGKWLHKAASMKPYERFLDEE